MFDYGGMTIARSIPEALRRWLRTPPRVVGGTTCCCTSGTEAVRLQPGLHPEIPEL